MKLRRITLVLVAALLALPAVYGKRKATVSVETLFENAELALAGYDIETLDELMEEIDQQLSKNRKASEADKEHLRRLQTSAVTLQNMLGRVEQLVIVDSLCVSVDSVPVVIRLNPEAGTLDGTGFAVTYTPALGREVFYTETDSAGHMHIMHAGILDDGTRQEPQRLMLFEDENVQTASPFMLQDGSTLYFAADAGGENALGGWDIYMTRRDEQGEFYEPTNVGMPYNSFGNDFMMVLDEVTGLGWWATDRNAPEGMATVFLFKPNSTRINYSPDSEGIADKAFITDFRSTWPENFDAIAAMEPLENLHAGGKKESATTFRFSPGNGKVYTSLNDFKNAKARQLMSKYLQSERKLNETRAELEDMRHRYGRGDLTLSGKIQNLEQRVNRMERSLKTEANAVARAEQ